MKLVWCILGFFCLGEMALAGEVKAIAGWTFQRTYDYIRSGPDYYGKGAPYFRVDLSFDLF
jgi:hypothetical protein